MSDTQAPADTVVLTINGQQVEAARGELVIEAAEKAGAYIPRFCYHPRMEPVGMCRMCVVDIDTGRGPALQPACMIPVAPDMVVDTASEATKKAQDGVLEFLLVNHPLDCPVCDKGGECPLQDQTLSYGPGESRFVEEKRHFEKPIPISDLVTLDRERCILCDRCTRFAKDVAGDALIHFQDRGNQTQVNTFPDHPFASYFSGNTVQICPVGALTATPYRFKARPWDLDQAESTCPGCAVGCRIVVQSSRNELLRYQGVDIDPVNWGWLCDKGRFSYEAVNSDERLGAPLVRQGDGLTAVSWGAALSKAAAALKDADPDRVAVLGGAELTNEDAYAWAKLAKGVIGTDHVDAQLADGLPADVVVGLPRATIDQACAKGGTILLLAPDLKEELPVLFLRLRHAVVHDGVRLVEVAPQRTSLTDLAAVSLQHRAGSAGEVIAALLAGGGDREVGGVEAGSLQAAAALLEAGPVTVILGRPSVGESAAGTVAAADAIHQAHPEVRFLSALRRGNVHGALDMGLAPGLLPGRVRLDEARSWFHDGGWATLPEQTGLDAAGTLEAAANGKVDVLVLLGADPLAELPDRSLATRGVAGARTVIAIDGFLTESAAAADVVLAAAGFAELDGTTTNLEGRVSTVARKITPPGTARAPWMIAAELARLLGSDLGLTSVADIAAEVAALAPSHAGLTAAVLAGPAAHDGVVVPITGALPGVGAAHATDSAATDTGPDLRMESADPGGSAEHMEGVPRQPGSAGSIAANLLPDEAVPDDAPPADAEHEATDAGAADTNGSAGRPPVLRRTPGSASPVPAVDGYSLRLVATRKLYDRGATTQRSASLAPLAPDTVLRLHPHDFDRVGVQPGTSVTLSSEHGSVHVPVVPDDGVPRGSAHVHVNQPGAEVSAVIDASAQVIDVRVVP